MPITLRPLGARTLTLCLLVALLAVPALPSRAQASAAQPSSVSVELRLAELINAARSAAGVASLRIDVRLVASSRAWSAQMGRNGGISHDPAIAQQVPSQARTHAENVAHTSRVEDPASALHELLMGSAPHRRNVLDSSFTDLGIGVVRAGGRTYVTQRFTAGSAAAVAPAVNGLARLAQTTFSQGADHAVIARDDIFADALTAGPLAGAGGPLLLTPPGPSLHPAVRVALERTLPHGRTIWLVGGTDAVSGGVAAELAAAGWDVGRVSGSTRVSTAAAVARAIAARDGRPDTVMVATADNWPDAIAGGAFGAHRQGPVLLTAHDAVPTETAQVLAELRPRATVVLGGSAAVSDRVVRSLGAVRVSGPTRQGTASETARRLWGYTDASPGHWIVAPAFGNDAWTWALGAAPLAARLDAAVLLVGPTLTAEVRNYVADLGYGGSRTAELTAIGPAPAAATAALQALLR